MSEQDKSFWYEYVSTHKAGFVHCFSADIGQYLCLKIKQCGDGKFKWFITSSSDSGFEDVKLENGMAETLDQAKKDSIEAAKQLMNVGLDKLYGKKMAVMPLEFKESLIKNYDYANKMCSDCVAILSKVIVCLQENDSHLKAWLEHGTTLVKEWTGREPE